MLAEQAGLFKLLKEFDSICRKHGIVYYLEGGSLLGAVRHRGFLPWDDDIDLCMTRRNWQRLLEVIDQELPENRELYCYERFPEYLRSTVKYTDLSTTEIFPNHILDGLACGQHIDIFVLDPAPSEPEEQAQFKALACVYSELMMPVYVMCEDIADHLELYEEYKAIFEEKGREYTLGLLREKLFTLDEASCDSYYLRWGNRHAFYNKEIYGDPVEIEFEGEYFYAPPKYYRYMHDYFGETWMQIPEASRREVHNTYDNFNVPCEIFISDYAPFIDYEQAREDYIERKACNIERIAVNGQLRHTEAVIDMLMYEVVNEDFLMSLSDEMQQLLDEGRYRELAALFDGYCSTQLDPTYIRNGLAIKVCEEFLYTAVLALAMTGRYGDAHKLAVINRDHSGCCSERISRMIDFTADIRECVILAEEGQDDAAAAVAEKWIGEFPHQIDIAAFMIRYTAAGGGDIESLIRAAEKLMSRYPDSDDLMKLMGDLFSAGGDDAAAEEWYERCLDNTRNGLYLMELEYLAFHEKNIIRA